MKILYCLQDNFFRQLRTFLSSIEDQSLRTKTKVTRGETHCKLVLCEIRHWIFCCRSSGTWQNVILATVTAQFLVAHWHLELQISSAAWAIVLRLHLSLRVWHEPCTTFVYTISHPWISSVLTHPYASLGLIFWTSTIWSANCLRVKYFAWQTSAHS